MKYIEDKLQLKFQLELKLISPEDVQQWAMQTLENDPSNQTALDLFFLKNEQDVYHYFKNLERRDFDSEIVNMVVYKVLYQFLDEQSEYIINTNQIDAFVKDTWNITLYTTNEELNTLVSYYDDEFMMIELGYKELEPLEIFNKFIIELKEVLHIFLD